MEARSLKRVERWLVAWVATALLAIGAMTVAALVPDQRGSAAFGSLVWMYPVGIVRSGGVLVCGDPELIPGGVNVGHWQVQVEVEAPRWAPLCQPLPWWEEATVTSTLDTWTPIDAGDLSAARSKLSESAIPGAGRWAGVIADAMSGRTPATTQRMLWANVAVSGLGFGGMLGWCVAVVAIVRLFRARTRMLNSGRWCHGCGYVLEGLVGAVCPECGACLGVEAREE